MTATASPFVPPHPERPRSPLPVRTMIRMARHNFLGVFDEKCFEYQFFSIRLLNRRTFICNSPDTVARAFVTLHDSLERKTPQMRFALAPLIGDGHFITDGALWRTRRRTIAPVVHGSRLPSFAPLMVEAAAETAARWARLPPGTEIDALREMAVLTADIICRTIFGSRLGDEYATETVTAFADYQRGVRQLDLAYMLGVPDWLPRFQSRAARQAARRIRRVIDHLIRLGEDRLAKGEPSMIRMLIEARDPATGKGLDGAALRNEAAVIFLAGHETTANSLAWIWFLLSQAPAAEERLHAELAAVLSGRLPTLEDVPHLVFTRAVFEEAIRLYPPVPMLGRQALRDEVIRRRAIPTGSLVVIIPWLLHRHKLWWERPDHFVPERFLPENAAARRRYSYVPFSVGPRVCAGQAFGLTEAVLCLATLAQAARLRLVPGTVVEPIGRLTLRPGERLPMRVERRG